MTLMCKDKALMVKWVPVTLPIFKETKKSRRRIPNTMFAIALVQSHATSILFFQQERKKKKFDNKITLRLFKKI